MNGPHNKDDERNLIVVIFIDIITGLVFVINKNIYIIVSQAVAKPII